MDIREAQKTDICVCFSIIQGQYDNSMTVNSGAQDNTCMFPIRSEKKTKPIRQIRLLKIVSIT